MTAIVNDEDLRRRRTINHGRRTANIMLVISHKLIQRAII